MKPISLFLRGFVCIRDGLGREELSLDLDTLAGGGQLIAIRGANGRGKTTVLDNLTPYPTMPSSAGGDGGGAFSYYDHVYLPESIKDLVWEHQGRRYRSQLVIRGGTRRRTEAYLHVWDQARWLPVRVDDGTVSDGKMETYERCLGAVLGAPRTFFTSVFAAQGRRQLCSYRTSEVKSLLADLLGLDDIRAKGQQATEVAKLLRVGLAGAREELAASTLEQDRARESATRVAAIDRELAALRVGRVQLQEQIRDVNAELASLDGQRSRAQHDAAERAALQAERERIDSAFAQQSRELADDGHREARRLARLQSELLSRQAEIQRTRADIAAQVRRARAVIDDADRIHRAARRLEAARMVVAARGRRVDYYRGKVVDLTACESQERSLVREIESLERAAGQAALRVEDLQRRTGLTQLVPCKGMPMQEDCRLLGDAHAARPLIPSAAAELERMNEARSKLREQLAQARAQSARLRAAPMLLAREEESLTRSRQRTERLTMLAGRRGEIVKAEAVLRESAERQESFERHTQESDERANADRKMIEQAMAEIDARFKRLNSERGKALETLAQRIAQMPPAFDVKLMDAARLVFKSAQAALQANEEALHDLLSERAAADEAQKAASRLHERCVSLETKCAAIEGELSSWSMFAKCMGGDGLIALMIDDAGPELARLANDLLVACYGPRFTLSIRTQVDTAKGETREGFEIMVHDGELDQFKSVLRMSGGERVWINDCLTRAIALYVAQSSGRRYETLFSDESDGPLDPERKRMFMRMKREVLRQGGYEREYFISQTPEMAGLADAVIDVDALVGGVSPARV